MSLRSCVLLLLLVFYSVDAARTQKFSHPLECDGTQCSEDTYFLLAMFRGVKLYNQKTDETTTVAPEKARCLDYHHDRREVYAYTNYTIMRYPIGSKAKAASSAHLVTTTDTAVTSLAVDWLSDLVYYIAEQQSAVYVTSREGGTQQLVISNNNTQSQAGWRSLVVDPHNKKLYWVGNDGVYCYSIEGKELLKDMIPWVHPVDSISLDVKEGLIYAIGRRRGESGSNKVITDMNSFTIPMNKGVVNKTVEVDLPATKDIYGFAVIGKIAYWESNHDGENIYKCNLEAEKTPVAPVVVGELNQVVYDMKVINKDLQTSSR